MAGGSRLHLPRSPARPGEAPDFGYLGISLAGEVRRPAIDSPAADMAELAQQMVRVLDEQHAAVGPWHPKLEAGQLRTALQQMVFTRQFDDRMLRMQRQGKISFYMQSKGEEAVSTGAALALAPRDMLFPSYRNQGLQFARGRNPADLMCQCLSNSRDMCKGRQMPVLYHWGEGRLFSLSGNLATQFPQAVGWAMAAAIKGDEAISAAWIGEGATAEPDFHHALTFASVYRAPTVLNVVNNQWAISTFQGFAGGEQRSFAARGAGYGIPSIRVDGNDLLAVCSVTRWAAERARQGRGATLIELVSYRAGAHSTSDDPSRYRPKDEYRAWPLGDPIERLKQHLILLGDWSEARHAQMEDEARQRVDACWQEALVHGSMTQGPFLDKSALFEDVFKEMPAHLVAQQEQLLRLEP